MKLLIVLCCFLALCESRSVKVSDDGTITVLTDTGKQVVISHPHGVKGERTIEIAGHDSEPIKHIKIDDDDVLGHEEVESTKDRAARTVPYVQKDVDDADLLNSAYKQKSGQQALWGSMDDHTEDWNLWNNKHESRIQILVECVSSHDTKQGIYDCVKIYETRWEFIDLVEKLINEKEKHVRKAAFQECVAKKEGKTAVIECLKKVGEEVEEEIKNWEETVQKIFGECLAEVKTVVGGVLQQCLHQKVVKIFPEVVHSGSWGGVFGLGHGISVTWPQKMINWQYPGPQMQIPMHYPSYGYHSVQPTRES